MYCSIVTFLCNLWGFNRQQLLGGMPLKPERMLTCHGEGTAVQHWSVLFYLFINLDILCLRAEFWNYKHYRKRFSHNRDICPYVCVWTVAFLSFSSSVLSVLWSHRKVLSEWLIRCFLFWRQCGLRRSCQCEKKIPTKTNRATVTEA